MKIIVEVNGNRVAGCFKGATSWEFWIGRLWWTIHFFRYWLTSGPGQIGWDNDPD